MKRRITINASLSATLPTASYANTKPGFLIEEGLNDVDLTDEQIKDRSKELYSIIHGIINEVADKAVIDRIQKEREDLRFKTNPDTGKTSPSVTSIIGFDADWFVSAEDLIQYAAQGTITHARVAHYIDTGAWIAARELQDIWVDMLILSKGDLRLSIDVGNFPAFLDKYKIKDMKNSERLFDKNDLYNGEPDIIGIPEAGHFKEALMIPTVFDVKRTPDKIKDGLQLSAYCKMAGVKQGIVLSLNDKTEQGFSKPVIYNKKVLDGYYHIFLKKREDFRKRYSI